MHTKTDVTPLIGAFGEVYMAIAAVRACPGISTERVSAILMCDVASTDQVLNDLALQGAVEGVQSESGAWLWFPEAWCHVCGCTTEAACEGGCGWTVGPGQVAEFGELAGICTRCA